MEWDSWELESSHSPEAELPPQVLPPFQPKGELEIKKEKPWSTTDAVFIDAHGSEVALVQQVAVILPAPNKG